MVTIRTIKALRANLEQVQFLHTQKFSFEPTLASVLLKQY